MLKSNEAIIQGLQSVYQFANSIGKRPQQLYQMVGNGSFPSEYIVDVKVPGGHRTQPMVKVAEATAWFSTKEEKQISGAVKKVIENPVMVAEAFIVMVEKDDPKLGKALRKWWATKNADTPEEK